MEVIPEDPILEFLPDTLAAVRKIYNLENDRMAQSVDILEEWIKKQKHFVNKNFGRANLERTIIACKGSIENAKTQIDKLCTFRTLWPKYFIDSNVRSTFESINQIGYFVPLPKMTKEYQRIFVIKLISNEFTSAHFLDYYRLAVVELEYIRAFDYNNGLLVIIDFREADVIQIVTKINLVDFQQYITTIMKGFGARLKGIHIISQSSVIDLFVKLLKSVMSDKIGGRICVHQHLDSLHQVVDKNLLPVDLGGNEGPLQKLQDEWMDVLASPENEKYLAVMKASCTDESLRQKDKFDELYVGLPGSFRTLAVD